MVIILKGDLELFGAREELSVVDHRFRYRGGRKIPRGEDVGVLSVLRSGGLGTFIDGGGSIAHARAIKKTIIVIAKFDLDFALREKRNRSGGPAN
jgi:hypothetical protein